MKNNNKLRILHITNWYPGGANPYDALWIKRQIQSLDPFCENYVVHIQVIPSSRLRWKKTELKEGFQFIMEIPVHKWAAIEYLTYVMLRKCLRSLQVNQNFDVIDFHIAYPLLTYWYKLKASISIPVLVNEHWSAYHYSFHVAKSEKLKRIRGIFSNKLPMIVVSKSLAEDVKTFAGNDDIEFFIVPNAIDVSIFQNRPSVTGRAGSFFMLSLWKYPKQPLTVIDAFGKFITRNGLDHLQLRIGGYGPLADEMKEFVCFNGLQKNVIFLGKLNAEEIAGEMNASLAFVHCSEYETFSVVCAEALCCGTPVIASAVGGIREFVTDKNGFLVDENTTDAWVAALKQFWLQHHKYQKQEMGRNAQMSFSMHSVGEQYAQVVRRIYDKRHNGISSYT